jgi:hypothetical protein
MEDAPDAVEYAPAAQATHADWLVAAAEPVLLQELRPKPVLVSFGTWL